MLQGNSSEELAKTKTQYESFLGDTAKLAAVREQLKVRSTRACVCGCVGGVACVIA